MDTIDTNTTWSLESEEWWARYREMIQKESMRAPGLPWTKDKIQQPAPVAAPEQAEAAATAAVPVTVPVSGFSPAPSYTAPCSGSAYGSVMPSSGSAYDYGSAYGYCAAASSGSAYGYGAAASSGYYIETSGSYIYSGMGSYSGSGSWPSSGSGSGSGSSGYGAEFGGYGIHLL